jgi:hypothetical protein
VLLLLLLLLLLYHHSLHLPCHSTAIKPMFAAMCTAPSKYLH